MATTTFCNTLLKLFLVSIIAIIIIIYIYTTTYYYKNETKLSLMNERNKYNNNNNNDNDNKWNYKNEWNYKYECGVVWYYHIGKVGGTNFYKVMLNKFSEYHKYYYNDNNDKFHFHFGSLDNNYNKSKIFYDNLIPFIENNLNKNKILFITQHHRSYSFDEFISYGLYKYIYSYIKYTKQCNLLFTILIREPIQHTLSILGYDNFNLNNQENINKTKNALINRIANFQIGYINYNLLWTFSGDKLYNDYNQYCINNNPTCQIISNMDKVNLNKSMLYQTIKILKYFNIIGYTEKYNLYLKSIYDIIFKNKYLIYNKTNDDDNDEFKKEIYKKHTNKLNKNKKINNIPSDILKLIINTHLWDLKLYHYLTMIDDKTINSSQIQL